MAWSSLQSCKLLLCIGQPSLGLQDVGKCKSVCRNCGFPIRAKLHERILINYEELCFLGCYTMWLVLRTDVSEEPSACFIRVTRFGELGITKEEWCLLGCYAVWLL
jgi:hypothetical protein